MGCQIAQKKKHFLRNNQHKFVVSTMTQRAKQRNKSKYMWIGLVCRYEGYKGTCAFECILSEIRSTICHQSAHRRVEKVEK